MEGKWELGVETTENMLWLYTSQECGEQCANGSSVAQRNLRNVRKGANHPLYDSHAAKTVVYPSVSGRGDKHNGLTHKGPVS